MQIHKYQCSGCGKSLCCQAVHNAYARYQRELAVLMAQPEPDRARIAFLTLLISAVHRRFPGIKDSAS